MTKPIPLKWFTAEEYARKGLEERDGRWYFTGCLIEADFEVSVESMTPYAMEILDRMVPFDNMFVCPTIRIIGGKLNLIDPEAPLD